MERVKNYLVVDFDPNKSGQVVSYMPLLEALESSSAENWKLSGPGIKSRALHSAERYVKYFLHAWKLFCDRKNVAGIVSIQQFYGILFAGYCMLFGVKKTTWNVIVSFIYKPKSGLIGNIYAMLMRKIICSTYIDRIYVHSQNEVEHYVQALKCEFARNKFEYLPLGIVDIGKSKIDFENQDYILSMGNSNRDFKFVEEALLGREYSVKIYSDEYPQHTNGNVMCCKGVPGNEYVDLIRDCFCVVVALEDENISSGQLTILQTYAMGKPVIITKTKGCMEYIIPPAGIAISKSKRELMDVIEHLRKNPDYYQSICREARKIFESKFSFVRMGETIGSEYLNDVEREDVN